MGYPATTVSFYSFDSPADLTFFYANFSCSTAGLSEMRGFFCDLDDWTKSINLLKSDCDALLTLPSFSVPDSFISTSLLRINVLYLHLSKEVKRYYLKVKG